MPRSLRFHTVKAGETLSDLSARFGLSVQELAAFNKKQDPNKLAVNEVLMVPMAEPYPSRNPQGQQSGGMPARNPARPAAPPRAPLTDAGPGAPLEPVAAGDAMPAMPQAPLLPPMSAPQEHKQYWENRTGPTPGFPGTMGGDNPFINFLRDALPTALMGLSPAGRVVGAAAGGARALTGGRQALPEPRFGRASRRHQERFPNEPVDPLHASGGGPNVPPSNASNAVVPPARPADAGPMYAPRNPAGPGPSPFRMLSQAFGQMADQEDGGETAGFFSETTPRGGGRPGMSVEMPVTVPTQPPQPMGGVSSHPKTPAPGPRSDFGRAIQGGMQRGASNASNGTQVAGDVILFTRRNPDEFRPLEGGPGPRPGGREVTSLRDVRERRSMTKQEKFDEARTSQELEKAGFSKEFLKGEEKLFKADPRAYLRGLKEVIGRVNDPAMSQAAQRLYEMFLFRAAKAP